MTQGTWAINDVVFTETFSGNSGVGGRDGTFTGTGSNNPAFDNSNWVGTAGTNKVFMACECVKIGSNSANGSCTTPTINLKSGVTSALLTFSAAGWDDNSTNSLTVNISTGTSSGDTSIAFSKDDNGEWRDYSVVITNITQGFTIEFTGKRVFLDDVVVRNLEIVEAPSLPESGNFWPNTTEAATKNITIVPASYSSVRYTTDGSTPTTENGTLINATSSIIIDANTTIKAIGFIGSLESSVVTKTYTLGTTFVNSIAEFNSLAEDTEAQLYLSTDKNARVLHGADGKMYLRDKTGTLCVDLGSAAAFNPAPVHNQHIAGWIVGKKQSVNGLSKLTNTTNTNTNHLALAAPVTEAATAPVLNIATDDINNYVGNWVTIKDVRNDGSSTTVSGIYNNALVDVSGIVTANNAILPVNYANIKPIVYVIDEEKEFISPDTNIEHATVRLKRTLSKDHWNTFTVPFNIPSQTGSLREYDELVGTTMKFKDASSIEAGKPYLMKPDNDIINPEYDDVTLSATDAQKITHNGYSFVGAYSPTELNTDKTHRFLTTDNKLGYPSSDAAKTIKGMRAYFEVPVNADARLMIDDETTGINNVRGKIADGRSDIYNLNGQKVLNPTKGLYVVNGKKMVIK